MIVDASSLTVFSCNELPQTRVSAVTFERNFDTVCLRAYCRNANMDATVNVYMFTAYLFTDHCLQIRLQITHEV